MDVHSEAPISSVFGKALNELVDDLMTMIYDKQLYWFWYEMSIQNQ